MKEPPIIKYKVIGYIHTPFLEKKGTPIQPSYSSADGTIEIFPQYGEGLEDLDGFSHVILLYSFNQVKGFQLKVKPFLDTKERGVFSTRAPLRPNPIGISIVELISIDFNTNILKVKGVDILDSTPLIDIKPYIPLFDKRDAKTGWISKHKPKEQIISDDRF